MRSIDITQLRRTSAVILAVLVLLLLAQFSFAQQQPGSEQSTTTNASVSQEPAVTSEPAQELPAGAALQKNFKVAWDTTIKESNLFRVKQPDPKLTSMAYEPFNINERDGDLNFHRGLVSDRLDVLSEIDVTYGDYGVRASTAGWIDPQYNRRLAPNPTTVAYISSDGTHFSNQGGWQGIQFRDIELLDAFAFGKMKVGHNNTLSFRLGQFAQLWGQTLFFGGNGIAGGMVPIDLVKALSVPNSSFKEIMRPVPQASLQFQIGKKWIADGYYQFLWEGDRFMGTGSYFDSFLSFGLLGGKRFFLPFGMLLRTRDIEGHNGGQFGGELLYMAPKGYDIGFYAIRYNAKAPAASACLNPAALGLPPFVGGPCQSAYPSDMNVPGYAGTYNLVYPSDINAFAVSVTKSRGLTNYAVEIGGKTHNPLNALNPATSIGSLMPAYNNTNNQGYAAGNNVYANISTVTVFNPNKLCKETTLMFEAAWNDLISYTQGANTMDTRAQKHGVGLEALYSLNYRQVRQGLDLMPQIGVTFTPMGKGAVGGLGVDKGGNVSVGLTLSYLESWRASVTYNTYYGPDHPYYVDGGQHLSYGQSMYDRDFISISIFHTFGARYNKKKSE
jgi:hypothetical protein